MKRTHFQPRFAENVWTGIVKGMLIGPFFLPNRLTGETYLDFLQNNLPQLIEYIPLNMIKNMLVVST